MSWIETWIDTARAPGLPAILAALDEAGARGINFYLGGRYSGGVGWTPELSVELARERPDVGQLGTWVSLRPGEGGYALGHQDGLDAVAAARAYPAIRWLCYDVEPRTWQAWPAGVDDAMRGFADAAHAAGYHVVDYGTPGTVAGASNEDRVWIANPNPGGVDPAVQPLNPSYYAGRRAVQFGTGVFAGVTWDLTHSEFSLGGDMGIDPKEWQDVYVAITAPDSGEQDPAGRTIPPHWQWAYTHAAAVQANEKLDQVLKLMATGGVDVAALAAALAPHLQQVDVAALEADLEAALPASTAAAVKAALAAALAK